MENELKIVYGMINFGEEREVARGSFEYIAKDVSDIKNSYIRLGFHLHEFERCKYYQDFGYSNFYDFCKANFALDKSAVSRCINVWWNFSDYDGSSHKMWVDERWKDYSYSQLAEMLPLSNDMRRRVLPEMTVKQIRELKKKGCDVVTSEEPEQEAQEQETKKFLSCNDLATLKGAALSAKVKSVDSIDSAVLYFYDRKTGKMLEQNVWVDILFKGRVEGDGGLQLVLRI